MTTIVHNFGDLFLPSARLSASQRWLRACSPWVSRSNDVHLIVFGGDLKSARSCNHLSSASPFPDPQSATMLWTKRVVLRRPGYHLGGRGELRRWALCRAYTPTGTECVAFPSSEMSYAMSTYGSRNPGSTPSWVVPRTQVADDRVLREWRHARALVL